MTVDSPNLSGTSHSVLYAVTLVGMVFPLTQMLIPRGF